jgi:fructokinase
MTILVVGEALIDVVAATNGPQVTHVGGSPLNVAVGLVRLGVPTPFASQVGPDRYGREVVDHLSASGVAFSSLPPMPRRTSTPVATLSDDGSAAYEFDLSWSPALVPDLDGSTPCTWGPPRRCWGPAPTGSPSWPRPLTRAACP